MGGGGGGGIAIIVTSSRLRETLRVEPFVELELNLLEFDLELSLLIKGMTRYELLQHIYCTIGAWFLHHCSTCKAPLHHNFCTIA